MSAQGMTFCFMASDRGNILVFDDGNERAAIVTGDLILFGEDMVLQARRLSEHVSQAYLRELEEVNPVSLTIDADYPGGNIVVEKIQGDTVYLRQDLRDTEGWWFYWNFRVRGAAGRTLKFEFTNGNPIGVRGPAVSTDGGTTWSWLGAEAVEGASFAYAFAKDAEDVRFCLGMAYQEADLQRFLKRYADNPHLSVKELCKTRKGRVVERLHAGKLDGQPRHRVLLTVRHHACEMMASYVLEGVLEAILADTDDGRWFRKNLELMAIPFVDKDGVEDGDQGKNRRPHDHNRDYFGQSIYPSVRAIKDLIPKWSEGRLRFALDMHCPWIRGKYHETILFPERLEGKENWQRLMVFLRMLEHVQAGPLVFNLEDSLSFTSWDGSTRNRDDDPPRTFSRWVRTIPGVFFSAVVEIPYANASGRAVTAETARAFGHDLARAMRKYLESLE